ncbi:MAG: hypothetical protein ACK5PS_01345 [Desulfopila sp.]
MSKVSATIPVQPVTDPSGDYYRLRREGIGFLAEMASPYWTDFNTHDPGVTILESLCYAITDLSYRLDWPIGDLLTPAVTAEGASPFPGQAFFTAREILTVNPLTTDDFRLLLIDLAGVRNAWLVCRQCGCEPPYYAWCDTSGLVLSFAAAPPEAIAPVTVEVKGLYDVLLELESDPQVGDLNDRQIVFRSDVVCADGQLRPLVFELRFPDWGLRQRAQWQLFLAEGETLSFQVSTLGATETFDLLAEPETFDRETYLRDHWQGIFFVGLTAGLTVEQQLAWGCENVVIAGVSLRLIGDSQVREELSVSRLVAVLENLKVDGFLRTKAEIMAHYHQKMVAVAHAVAEARRALDRHRNLAEEFCSIRVVDIEEIGVCAEVEVSPASDIEWVQARIWFVLERYFNPPVPLYSFKEMADGAEPVEEIFNGPALASGFVRRGDLTAADLKTELNLSDIINLLMDIDGVITVRGLQLVKYDGQGRPVGGVAGSTWQLPLTSGHQPRLYLGGSRFLFFAGGLPFLPRADEAADTLQQLRGAVERPKLAGGGGDLLPSAGSYRDPGRYYPLQYTLPELYGIGPQGLPLGASPSRRGQARQLKAYLMVFEQLLANAFAQLGHLADLFSLDPDVADSYFTRMLGEEDIRGAGAIVEGLSPEALQAMTERRQEFYQRRNRFLDHLLARFGEQFAEYGLVLTSLVGRQAALNRLIHDKIKLLATYPRISRDRARAFDYKNEPNAPENVAGLARRIALLLGSPELNFIVVEHVLLRPKFPGDALYPVCCEGGCATGGDEDPYSFRLTFVMPGWQAPFADNLEMRDFADRTIRRETPAHLLARVCWPGNDSFTGDPCDPVLVDLAEILSEHALTAAGERPDWPAACDCAAAIYQAFGAVFSTWFDQVGLEYLHPDALASQLAQAFADGIDPAGLSCSLALGPAWPEVEALMLATFSQMATSGRQFDRFARAWRRWLAANATIDWGQERLPERLVSILAAAQTASAGEGGLAAEQLAERAQELLLGCGMAFTAWMDNLVGDDQPVADTVFEPPEPLPGEGFLAGTGERIRMLLRDRYNAYKEPSYRLRIVVNLLAGLTSRYPPATLHDWDEGSDQNPVRLGKTALGRKKR